VHCARFRLSVAARIVLIHSSIVRLQVEEMLQKYGARVAYDIYDEAGYAMRQQPLPNLLFVVVVV
jgi:hypothetical protein